jgi:Protein of unknown function (DUF2950)
MSYVMFPFVLFILLAACGKAEKPAAEQQKPRVTESAQRTFASPEEAGVAFLEAAKAGDESALLAIFGPDGKEVLLTGDSAKDKDTLQEFVAAYNQMHRWGKIKAGGEVLKIGGDNYPFPIPLGQNPAGQWYFDTAAGKDEILARRIGLGESNAIAACEATARAEHQYFNQNHDGSKVKQYAQKFASDPGRQNGLYWPASEHQSASPLDQFGDFAAALGSTNDGDAPKQFNGYSYRILTKQGDKAQGGAKDYLVDGKMIRGFAILAYPTEYRNTGIMSFAVGPDGFVYQKDLGERTADLAAAFTEFNPGDGWSRVEVPSQASASRSMEDRSPEAHSERKH